MTGVTNDVKSNLNRAADMKLFDKIFLSMTLFIVGGVIMMLELVGTRILAPFFGNTIYTWSSLITVTLVALAIGYFVGGVTADKKPDLRILYLIIYLVCVWMVFIPHLRYRVLLASSGYGVRLGTLLSASVLFALPLTLLGTAVPFAIKMETERLKTVGTTAGSLFAISTVGSFIGTVLTGFYLIPNMEIGRIMFLGALLLLTISSGWFLSRRDWRLFLTLFVIFLFSSALAPSIAAYPGLREGVDIVYKGQGLYGEVKVVDRGNERYLFIDGFLNTALDKTDGQHTALYVNYMEISAFFNPEAKDALAIGLGGGMIQKRLESYGMVVDTVEIDPMMVDVAANYFDFERENVYIGDGRLFVQNSDKEYDIIILDAFSSSIVPFHLLTLEMFRECDEHLTEDGLLVVNTVGYLDSELEKSLYRTLLEVYPEVHVYATDKFGGGNVLFFAAKERLQERIIASGGLSSHFSRTIGERCEVNCRQLQYLAENRRVLVQLDDGAKLLTDDYNPTEVWQAEYGREIIRLNQRYYGNGVLLR